ncbi:AI-2E family transporter [uncultured Pelagimonas sp.]|uniref:AI-2E family transporter n=1 Tax=uncultured Pelagimonas sp. TaxID=1618102 RepID=UPI002628086A|nr:AI-2E family transporter [uncultured Pelagimonas sp.]
MQPDDKERPETIGARYGMAFWAQLVVFCFFVIAGLVYAANLLIPLSLALLLAVLISAIVDRARQGTIFGNPTPEWLAYVLAFGVVSFGFAGILYVLSNQAGAVAEAFPRYEARFELLLKRFEGLIGEEGYATLLTALADLNLSEMAGGAISSAGSVLSGIILVLLLVPFMLLERNPMNVKLDRAVPNAEARAKVSQILNGMSISLQRYVGIKTLVSLITGIGSYAVMKPVGLDFAETWGILAFALNFIPTIGSILGVVLPGLVALVQFDTFTPFLIIVGGCGAVQFVIGNIVEPSLTGRSLNLSPLVVVLSLSFWTIIWGMSGALLSVPITVCGLIIISHFPATRPLAVLMSGDGTLMTETREEALAPVGKPLNKTAEPTEQEG